MNTLDWLLVVLLLGYAISGYWQGFITGAFATVGLLLGGLLGIWLAPQLLGDRDPSVWVSLGALFIVLVAASLGQALFQYAGRRIRDLIPWQPVRALDAVGGGALSVVAVLVVAWALGVALSGAALPWVTREVQSSSVLGKVNELMPEGAVRILGSFNDVVGTSFFPRYLEPFAPEHIVRVDPPPPRIGRDAEVVAAGQSVVKIRGESDCGRGIEGTGFFFQPDRVMTNAHVVAGVADPQLVVGGQQFDATVVAFDPRVDVAVLRVEGLRRPFLRFDDTGRAGEAGAVLGFPEDGPYDVRGARIRGQQRLRSPDIYGDGTVIRDVFSLRSLIRPGNSGGPVVSPSGKVLGVVFAASVSDDETGYALTAEQVAPTAAAGAARDSAVSSGDCA